jgi:geranylgeranyl pyrophosphate synthase
MWNERQAELLGEEIEALLAPLSKVTGFYDLVREPLTKLKRGLAPNVTRDWPWPLIPLIVCEAICGRCEHAIPAAVALQLFLTAGDVFDDIEDADSSESLSAKYGFAKATNVATTLLILAEKAITRLKDKGVEDSIIVSVMNTINSYYTTACMGQHLDLSFNSEIPVSEETYLKIIEMKSASQVECACKVGVLLARAKQELVNIFTYFGHYLGLSSQIANDIQGFINGRAISKNNISLPVVFALNRTDNKAFNKLRLLLHKSTESTRDTECVRELLFSTGAIQYATVKMEFYKQKAWDILVKAEEAGASVERLKLFLD